MPPPRVMVFQPSFTVGAPLDFRVLGVQFWLAHRLVSEGFEAASCLLTDPRSTTVKKLVAVEPPSDPQTLSMLGGASSQFGVLLVFAVERTGASLNTRLDEARLVKADGGGLAEVARIHFEGDNDLLPLAAHQLFEHLMTQLGKVPTASTWQDAFGTTDPAVASSYLAAFGVHGMCVEGIRCEQAEAVLRVLLPVIATRNGPAVALLPSLVASLRSSGSANEDLLRDAVEAAVGTIAPTPPVWAPMLRELGLTPRHDLN